MSSPTLFSTKVREESGSATSARYQFQTNWAIIKLCDLYATFDVNFHVLLDQFDDVVTIIPSNGSDQFEFFQVKGKASGNWTVKAISKNESGSSSPASIVGKLYANAAQFGVSTSSINFLSNAGFNATLADGTKVPSSTMKIQASQLHDSELKHIDDCLEPDFPSPRSPICSDILFLERTSLGLTGQQTFVVGRLAELMSSIGSTGAIPFRSLYETLFADLSAKAASGGTYHSDAELLTAKAVSRSEFSKLIEAAQAEPKFASLWPAVEHELLSMGKTSIEALKLRRRCVQFIALRATGKFEASRINDQARITLNTSGAEIDDKAAIISEAEKLAQQVSTKIGSEVDIVLPGAIVSLLEYLDEKN